MSNFFSKLASAVSVVTLVAASTGSSVVSAASEFSAYAQALADNGVITAQSTEAGYRLGDNVTRAELAKVVANLGGYTATACAGDVFSDVGSGLGDLCGYVEALAEAGVVSTSSATFRPTANVTRAEMVKMILGALGETASSTDAGYTDLTGLGDLAGFVNRANEIGCAADASYFRPNATASRGEAFKIASCAAQLEVTTPVDNSGSTTTGSTTTGSTVAGALTVALNGSAVAQYVPKNASSVKVGTVKLTAGTSAVTVSSLVVSRSGLGEATDIKSSNGIRAAQSGVIISSSADYYNSTSQKGNIYFSPALTIAAGASVNVDILVNLSGAQNSQHQFTLDSVNAGASSVTGAPVTLGLLNTTSYTTANTTAILSTSAGTLTPGKTNQSVVKVELTSGGRDTVVNGFTLTRAGVDFTKRLANVKIYRGGVQVGTVSLSNEKLSVTGLNDTLTSGNTQTYEVKADILVDGSATGDLGFKFDATSDVSASELATGYSTTVSTTPAAGTAVTITFSNVEVTFAKLSTGNLTLAPGTNNVKLFNGKLTSSVPLTVRGLKVTPTSTLTGVTDAGVATASGIAAFVNNQLSVKVNGSEVATITDLTTQTLLPSFVVDAANPATITIEGSLKSSQVVNGAVTFAVEITDARDSSNNTATIGAGKSLTGDKTTVNTAAVEVKTATIAAPTTTRLFASADQEIGRFAVYAQNEAARLQKIVFTNASVLDIASAATGNATQPYADAAVISSDSTQRIIASGAIASGATLTAANTKTQKFVLMGVVSSSSSLKLYDVATGLEVSASVTVNGNTVTFDSMNDTIAKDTTKNYRVVASVGSIDDYLGKTVQLAYSSSTIVRDTNSNTLTGYPTSVSFKTYTLGTVPPTVTLAKTATLDKYLVTVTNADTNTGITLTGVTIKFQSRFAGSTSTTFTGKLCLRDQGSSEDCTVAGGNGTSSGVTVDQNGTGATFSLAGLTSAGLQLSKNGGNTTFEVYLTNAPLFIAGDYTQVSLDKVYYGGTSESYVGITSATAQNVK